MHHIFFSSADNVAYNCATFDVSKLKSNDLKIRPNGQAYGIPVEIDAHGHLVGAVYPNGDSVRNNYNYVLNRNWLGNSLTDLQLREHPLD